MSKQKEDAITRAEAEVERLSKLLAECDLKNTKEYVARQEVLSKAIQQLESLKKIQGKKRWSVDDTTKVGGLLLGAGAVISESCGQFFRTDTAKTVIRTTMQKLLK